MSETVFLRKYGATATIDGITLIARGALDLKANPTLAAGDVKISKDGGTFNNLTTLPTVTPAADTSVQISLSATEMQAARIAIKFVDQTGPKEWEDKVLIIETFGNASGQITGDFNNLDAAVSLRALEATAQSVLTETQSHPTLPEIEASTILALASATTAILNEVNTHPTLPEIEASAVLAKEASLAPLTNGTYGLAALNTDLDTIISRVNTPITGAVVSDVTNGASRFKTNLASASADIYKDTACQFTSGALNGQVRKITTSDTSAFIQASSGYTATPNAGDTFKLING